MALDGYEECPVIHLRLAKSQFSIEENAKIFDLVVQKCYDRGIAIVTAKYLDKGEHKLPPPR